MQVLVLIVSWDIKEFIREASKFDWILKETIQNNKLIQKFIESMLEFQRCGTVSAQAHNLVIGLRKSAGKGKLKVSATRAYRRNNLVHVKCSQDQEDRKSSLEREKRRQKQLHRRSIKRSMVHLDSRPRGSTPITKMKKMVSLFINKYYLSESTNVNLISSSIISHKFLPSQRLVCTAPRWTLFSWLFNL